MQTLTELGQAVRAARRAAGLTTVDVARASGRSRDVLHRLESGQDVAASSLLAILAAIGRRLEIGALARPALGEMQRHFAHLAPDAAEDDAASAPAAQPRRGRR